MSCIGLILWKELTQAQTPILIQLLLQPLLGGDVHVRAQRPSRPSDPSSSMSVPPIQLGDATTVTETTHMSSVHTTTSISSAHTTTPISTIYTTTPILAAHTTTPISSAHTTFMFVPTPSFCTPHHEHTVSFLTQTFNPLASFLGVTPSSPTQSDDPSLPTQSIGPSSVTQSIVPTSATQSSSPASVTQLGGPASTTHQPSGPSSATQLEDLVGDIDVGDHGRGRGRDTKWPQLDMPVVLKRNPPRNKKKPCCETE